jgi:predicted nucleotidyltransferase
MRWMADLDLSLLPNLPQRARLVRILTELWIDPNVVALWLSGSLARGEADPHSDVDLHVALRPEAFDPERLPDSATILHDEAVAVLRIRIGLHKLVHHMLLVDGEIYDVSVQSPELEPSEEARLVLDCRDEMFGAMLDGGRDEVIPPVPVDGEAIQQLLVSFWMTQQKHLKVLHRGLSLLAWEGEIRARQDLIRLWSMLATGCDPGPVYRMTVHTLTPVIRTVQELTGTDGLALVGAPLGNEAEIIASSARLRDEFARVGRALAERFGFEYPADAEQTVRRSWQEFLSAR